MEEPPEYDYMEDEDEFEEMCREELLHLAEHEMEDDMAVEMAEQMQVEEGMSSSNNTSSVVKNIEASMYSSPHKLYQSPEVFKELNNEFSKRRNNSSATALSFAPKATDTDDVLSPHVQQNVSSRGPQIQSLLTSCLFTTQLPPFIPVTSDIAQYLDDRPNAVDGDGIATITLGNGARKFLRHRKLSYTNNPNDYNGDGMLSRPIGEILKEAEATLIAKKAEEQVAAQNKASSRASVIKSSDVGNSVPALNHDKELWVDKYSPKNFTQLLSSEKINREVLRSIKLWDKFVFNRNTQKAEKRYYDVKGNVIEKPDFGYSRGAGGSSQSNAPSGGEGSSSISGGSKATSDTRPEFKLILLAGPPGTGKTTLAHIVAQHCGYRTIEVNASDDRTVDSLRDIISRSVSNNTLDEHFVMDDESSFSHEGGRGNSKPNCIILDEIDGMDGRQPIDALISIAKTGLDSNKQNKKGGNKKGHIILTRPIICICNDQFSPILRDLRKYAQVFVFGPSTDMRLVARLKQICSDEGILSVASSSLSALSQASGGDIRSAINTLQFAALRAQAQVGQSSTTSNVSSFQKTLGAMIKSGVKDERQDVFQLWGQIFSFKAAAAKFSKKFKLLSGGNTDNDRNNPPSRGFHAMKVLDTILGYNDHQLVLNGVQENYLSIKYTDPSLIKTCSAAEWLSVGNVFEGKLASGEAGSHSSTIYIPGVIAVIHLLCASDTNSPLKQSLQYPRKLTNCRYNRQQREHILEQFYDGACTRCHCLGSKMSCAMDCIPQLLDILAMGGAGSGAVRPGPMQMHTESEKNRIQRVADVMMAFSLTYERQTIVDSYQDKKSPYQLEPAIEILTLYDEGGEEYAERRAAFATSSEVKHLLYLDIRSRVQKAQYSIEHEESKEQEENGEEDMANDAMITSDDIVLAEDNGGGSESGVKRTLLESQATDSNSTAIVKEDVLTPALSEKKTKLEDKKCFSFFKPPPAAKTSSTNGASAPALGSKAAASLKKKNALRYKFCAGFSNAVKRPVTIREFIGKS